MSTRKSFFLAARATTTCCTDVRHLQQRFASRSIAAAAAAASAARQIKPGSASPYARLAGLTLAPILRVHTHTRSTYPVLVFLYSSCFPPRKSATFFETKTLHSTTWHVQEELLVAGTTTTTAVQHLQQSFSGSKTAAAAAAAVAIGPTRPGSASLYARLVSA